jgi:DNA (cytosine-5)-methyltransferase 1
MKPRLLDLFCGAGGAAMGYSRAGFEVVGVDIAPQPNYPFEFIQADALKYLQTLLDAPWLESPRDVDGEQMRRGLADFDAIHASPPCQRFSTATKRNGTELEHPDLVSATRTLLGQTGLPWVIENVLGAPIRRDYVLCGTAFPELSTAGYRLKRHRAFEVSWADFGCAADDRPVMDVTGGGPTRKQRTDGGGGRPYKGTADEARAIMGIDWMTKAELNEAIPPAYTEYMGSRLLEQIRVAA